MKQEETLKSKLLIAVLSVSLLILCGLLTETATNIAFPTLMEEYGVNASAVQWLTTGKMLVVAMITPHIGLSEKAVPDQEAVPVFGAYFPDWMRNWNLRMEL